MNPYVLLGVGAAWLVSLGAASWFAYDYAQGQHAQEQLLEERIAAKVRAANLDFADGVARRTETAIGGIRIEHRTINREVQHEREIHVKVLENPDCAIPTSTVRLLNAAAGYVSARPSTGQPAAAVSAPGAP